MQAFPSYPTVAEAPTDLFERGHVWLHELVDGARFRFQALEDGSLRFGDEVRVFGSDVPPGYDHAARHVRESLDYGALRAAVDDVESVVFFGYAMHRCGVDYDWERVPNVLGSDVWSGERERYLNPDRVEKIYRRLGLASLDTVRAELRAADFDPDDYAFPASEWYDGPVAGVLVRNKTGLRARIENPAVVDSGTGDAERVDDAAAFARQQATTARFEGVARRLREEGRPVTFDALYERTAEVIVRANHRRLFDGATVDRRAFRSVVAERAQAYLAARERE